MPVGKGPEKSRWFRFRRVIPAISMSQVYRFLIARAVLRSDPAKKLTCFKAKTTKQNHYQIGKIKPHQKNGRDLCFETETKTNEQRATGLFKGRRWNL